MTATEDIVRFEFDISDDWYELPLDRDAGESWARSLADRLLAPSDPVGGMLRFQLERVQANLSSMDVPGLTAAVWIPTPGTGYVSSVIGFHLAALLDGDTPERYLEDFESDRGRDDDSTWLEVDTWRGDIPAGPFVAVRNLISHLDDEKIQSWVEERTLFAVFPPGARQSVQVFFSAESIGSFWDMPAQTQAVVETLRVELGQPA